MIKEFIDSKKYKDYYNFCDAWECKISIVLTISMIIILYGKNVDLYNNFDSYIVDIKNIFIYFASGLLGIIGISLAGIALVLSLFDNDFKRQLNSIGRIDLIDTVLLDFKFLIFNLGIGSVIFFFLYMLLPSEYIFSIPVFYLLVAIIIYYKSFLVFYTISIILNCISIYEIKNSCNEIEKEEKNIYDRANELRIEYILSKLDLTEDSFLEEIEQMIDNSNYSKSDNEELKKYINDFYRE